MSRDGVAVPPALAMVANTLCLTRLTDGFCGARNQPTCLKCREAAESLMRHSWLSARALDWVLRHASGIEKAAEQNASVAALTREAAPQASGGDELPCTDSDNCRRCSEDADTPHSGIPRGTLATTDSAIQSQQGATGGAVDDAMVERAYRAWQAAVVDEHHVGNRESLRIALIAALAHPQAAGSAPGEAREAVAWAMRSPRGTIADVVWSVEERDGYIGEGWSVEMPLFPPSAGSVASGAGDCPYSARCDCIGACKHGFAGNGATAAGSAPVGVESDKRQGLPAQPYFWLASVLTTYGDKLSPSSMALITERLAATPAVSVGDATRPDPEIDMLTREEAERARLGLPIWP